MLCHFTARSPQDLLLMLVNSNICTMLQRLSEDNKDRLRNQFDKVYFVANNKFAFSKYTAI